MRWPAFALMLVSSAAPGDGAMARPSWELRWPRTLPCNHFVQAIIEHTNQVDWQWRGDSAAVVLPMHYQHAGEPTAIALAPPLDAGRLHTLTPLGKENGAEPYLLLRLRCTARAPDASADVSWWTNPHGDRCRRSAVAVHRQATDIVGRHDAHTIGQSLAAATRCPSTRARGHGDARPSSRAGRCHRRGVRGARLRRCRAARGRPSACAGAFRRLASAAIRARRDRSLADLRCHCPERRQRGLLLYCAGWMHTDPRRPGASGQLCAWP